MSIQIQENKCIGCRKCVEVCPGNLIKINEKREPLFVISRIVGGVRPV